MHRLCEDQGGREVVDDCALLAHPYLILRPDAPYDSPSLVNPPEEGPPLSGMGRHLASVSRILEPPVVAPGWDMADLSGLSQAVINIITEALAPSTRQA